MIPHSAEASHTYIQKGRERIDCDLHSHPSIISTPYRSVDGAKLRLLVVILTRPVAKQAKQALTQALRWRWPFVVESPVRCRTSASSTSFGILFNPGWRSWWIRRTTFNCLYTSQKGRCSRGMEILWAKGMSATRLLVWVKSLVEVRGS